jgi:hypothetical protein
MKIPVWLLTSDDDSSGRQVEAYGSEAAADNAAAALVATMAEQEKLVREVETGNWRDVLSELQVRPGFDNFLWLDQVEVDVELGPLAISIEGGMVQDAVSDDKRLHGLDVLMIDYDTDGAEVTYNITQRDRRGKVDGVSEAVVSDRAVGPASGIDLAELWHNYLNAEDGLDEAEA